MNIEMDYRNSDLIAMQMEPLLQKLLQKSEC